MRHTTLLALGLALACAYRAASATPGEAEVRVHSRDFTIHIAAQVETRADRATAWRVLTDYPRWPAFIPSLQVSRILSAPGEPLRVEQRATLPWLPAFPLVVIAEVRETPTTAIQFRRIAGNILNLEGEWRILGNTPVRLEYRASIEPGFPMPAQVSEAIFRQDAKLRLEAMAAEMARLARIP